MKHFLALSLLLFSLGGSFAQKPANNPIDSQLSLLVSLKAQYEEYRELAKNTSNIVNKNKYTDERDTIHQRYLALIKTVKDAPEIYLVHINKAIKAGKVVYDGPQGILYNYFNPISPAIDWGLYFLPRLEAYKMIKRSLFDKNESLLPERTDLYIQRGGRDREMKLFIPGFKKLE